MPREKKLLKINNNSSGDVKDDIASEVMLLIYLFFFKIHPQLRQVTTQDCEQKVHEFNACTCKS